jgi:aspartyl-tRNA(Asn)/glutamyl-tRNA(Gln) amidotransferase subunit C
MDDQTVDKLLRLSQLALDDDERARLINDLNNIIAMIDEMQAVDTEGVPPLAHPLDVTQPLRADEITEVVDREHYQSIAPYTKAGLYLVPRVVE